MNNSDRIKYLNRAVENDCQYILQSLNNEYFATVWPSKMTKIHTTYPAIKALLSYNLKQSNTKKIS